VDRRISFKRLNERFAGNGVDLESAQKRVKMKAHRIIAGLLLVAATALAGEPANDSSSWPQFRGPGGLGQIKGKVPVSWSNEKNVAWKTAIPGTAWSSPVVALGKAWLSTSVANKAGGASLRLVGVDLKSGEIKDDVELFAITKLPTLHARNTPASPTPAVVGNRVIASFGADGVGCVDAATGKVLWRNDALKVNYQTGAASSPVPYKDWIILACDGADLQFAVALDAATGKEIWKTNRTAAVKHPPDQRRAFSSALVFNDGKQDQVVIPGAQRAYSYNPDTGEELWWVNYNGFSNVPRPVFANGLVYITTGFAAHELMAIRPDGKGDVTSTHVVWRSKKSVPSITTPVVVGSLLFMISDSGVLTCLDAKSGKMKWTERLQGQFTASPLFHGNTVYVFADNGSTVLFKAADSFEEIGSNQIKGKIQATPAAGGGGLLIRTDTMLYLLADTKSGSE
jgi:outer membrane protein assembly factor BamB